MSGVGQVSEKIVTEMAAVTLGVEIEAKTANEALENNARQMAAVLDVFEEFGIAKSNVRTTNYSLFPRFERRSVSDNSTPKIVGFGVSNSVAVKVSKLDDLGAILDSVVNSGANRISGISFGVSDPSKHLDVARQKAVEKAMAKATVYAEAAGVKLGTIRSITESQDFYPQPQFQALERVADSTPISEGEVTISATVTIQFEIN